MVLICDYYFSVMQDCVILDSDSDSDNDCGNPIIKSIGSEGKSYYVLQYILHIN